MLIIILIGSKCVIILSWSFDCSLHDYILCKFLGPLVIYSSMESAMNYYILNFCVFDLNQSILADIFFCFDILQSTHMASQQITEEAVYLCTGNPLPKDIEQISYWLLNEQYSDSFKSIQDCFKPFINVFSIYNHSIVLICIIF